MIITFYLDLSLFIYISLSINTLIEPDVRSEYYIRLLFCLYCALPCKHDN